MLLFSLRDSGHFFVPLIEKKIASTSKRSQEKMKIKKA